MVITINIVPLIVHFVFNYMKVNLVFICNNLFIGNNLFLSIQQQNGQQNVHYEYVTSGIEGDRVKRAAEVSLHTCIYF